MSLMDPHLEGVHVFSVSFPLSYSVFVLWGKGDGGQRKILDVVPQVLSTLF